MKPEPAYFAHITDTLAVQPTDLILIDDREPNVVAALKAGREAFHFTDGTRGSLAARLFSPKQGRRVQ